MADFLNRLAARALGATPLAEPVIPTRFSSSAEQSAFLANEPASRPTRPDPDTSLETCEDRPHSLHIREANSSSETSVALPVSPFRDLDEAPHLPRSQRLRAFSRQTPPPPDAESETVRPSPERAEVHKQSLAPAMPLQPMDPSRGAVEETTAHNPQATPPTPAPFAEPKPAPRLTPLAEPTRGPALQHPQLLLAFRPAPPTVRISIGRVEVRAEITSPSTTAPLQRPRPSTLSLDQFLKQVDRSAR
jgi:hypothetical protein